MLSQIRKDKSNLKNASVFMYAVNINFIRAMKYLSTSMTYGKIKGYLSFNL